MPVPLHTHRSQLEALLDLEQTEIMAQYRSDVERAKSRAEELLRLHREKRRHVITLLGAVVTTK